MAKKLEAKDLRQKLMDLSQKSQIGDIAAAERIKKKIDSISEQDLAALNEVDPILSATIWTLKRFEEYVREKLLNNKIDFSNTGDESAKKLLLNFVEAIKAEGMFIQETLLHNSFGLCFKEYYSAAQALRQSPH